MAAILSRGDEPEQKWSPFEDIFTCALLTNFCTSIQILLKLFLLFFGNKSTLLQVMAWHLFGAKPLSEPMVTQFIDLDMYVCFISLQGCCQLLNLDVMVMFCVLMPQMAFLVFFYFHGLHCVFSVFKSFMAFMFMLVFDRYFFAHFSASSLPTPYIFLQRLFISKFIYTNSHFDPFSSYNLFSCEIPR